MKSIYDSIAKTLFTILITLCYNAKGQVFNFTVSNPCQGANLQAQVTATSPGATSYSWAVAPSNTLCFSYTSATTPPPNAGVSFSPVAYCSGVYTIFCYALISGTVTSTLMNTFTVNPGPTISISTSSAQTSGSCSPVSFTLNASGGTNYTWSTNSAPYSFTGATIVNSVSTSGIYTVGLTSSGTSGCATYSTMSYTISSAPINLTIYPSSTVTCSGSPVTLNTNLYGVPGTYSWSSGSTSSIAIVTPTANSCYTLNATTSGGCSGSASVCIGVNAAPQLTQVTTQVCANSSVFVQINGATNYTANYLASGSGSLQTSICNGCGGFWVNNLGGCYTLSAYNSTMGCSTNSVFCPTILPSPTITVSSFSVAMGGSCSPSAYTLNASGATNYTWYNTPGGNISGTNTISFNTSTSVNGNISITGISANGCSGGTNFSYNSSVISPTIFGGNQSICFGNTATFNGWATGATNYSWSTGSTNNTITVSPSVTTIYTLSAWNSTTGCSGTATTQITVNTTTTLNITAPGSVCANQNFNATASGGVTYTWASNMGTWTGSNVSMYMSAGCLTLWANSGGSCSATSTLICPSILPVPSVSISGPNNICTGSNPVYTVSGNAITYTWNNGSNATTNTYTSSTSGGISVIGTSSAGCTAGSSMGISVVSSPTISISGNSISCNGSSQTLTASGATSYTWSNNATGASIVVTPTTNTCYSVIGTAFGGCSATAVKCVSVGISPTVTVSGPSTVCAVGNSTLTASGASTYSWLSSGITTSTRVVSNSASTCYSVIGFQNGCSVVGVYCSTVGALPTYDLGITSKTVCLGSSATFSALSSCNYSWSNGSASNTMNVIPTNTGVTVYSVVISHSLNNCTRTGSVTVFANPNCVDVWPGDANSDGVVNSSDVLEIGLWSGMSGATRFTVTNAWASQYAIAWTGTISSGKNRAHADCNGDGFVNSNDTAAITANFSNTHAFKGGAQKSNGDIKLIPQSNVAYTGIWNVADIVYGDAINVQNVYGVSYDLNFNQSIIQTDSVKIISTSSFLNASNGRNNIEFSKIDFANGIIHAASVRTDQNDVNGFGKIGEFWYKINSNVANGTQMTMGTNNAQKVNANAVFAPVTSNPNVVLLTTDNLTGILEKTKFDKLISFSPNPTSNELILQSSIADKISYSVNDITGREILKGEFSGNKKLDVSILSKGTYFIKFELNGFNTTKKLLIAD